MTEDSSRTSAGDADVRRNPHSSDTNEPTTDAGDGARRSSLGKLGAPGGEVTDSVGVPHAEPSLPDLANRDPNRTVVSKRPPASAPIFDRAATPFEMGRTLEGQQLDHFQLEEFVGGGGMGAVFRASDTKLGRTVAVKVVSRTRTSDDALRRFRNEAQSAARLDHPNIARVYYVGEDKGWDYIVFEYIEGINVRDLVEQVGALTVRDVIRYTVQIAEALEHASRRDVIHRDIKPSNILIMADGHAKLVDMGLARLQQVESAADDLTESGVTLGTFDYISPEQASDPRAADVRSDLYSLGCTMYFMLTGQPPFPEGTMLQKLLKHSSMEPPDPRALRGDLPDELALIVDRLLAKSPDDRYQQPHGLIAELVRVAEHLDISGIHPIDPLWMAAELSRPRGLGWHLPWIVPVAVLLLAVGGLQFRALVSRAVEPPPPRLVERRSQPPPAMPSAGKEDATPGGDQSIDKTANDDQKAEPTAKPDAGDAPTKKADSNAGDSPSDSPSSPVGKQSPDDKPAPAAEQDSVKDTSNADGESNRASPDGEKDASGAPPSYGAAVSAIDDALGEDQTEPSPVIMVADQDIEMPVGWHYASSLENAVQIAASLTQPATIALYFNGVHSLQPLQLDLRGFAQQKLTIRAASGFAPVLAIADNGESASADDNTGLIGVSGGHLTLVGVQLQWDASSTGNGDTPTRRTLFSLSAVDRVELRDCVLTIRDRDETRSAAFFAFARRTQAEPEDVAAATVDAAPTIWMERCLVRGQATLVRAERAIPFLLFWDQGLFASTQRLVEMGGTEVEPRWEHGRATLFFQRLLAVAQQGICLVQTDSRAPFSLGLTANSYDCLFVGGNREDSAALFEVRNDSAFTEDSMLLSVGGNNNYYKNTQVVLRLRAGGDPDATLLESFEDLKKQGEVAWYHEKDPQPATMFSWDVPGRPADQLSLDDFQPAAGPDGTLERILGITTSQLPRPHDGVAPKSTPDSGASRPDSVPR